MAQSLVFEEAKEKVELMLDKLRSDSDFRERVLQNPEEALRSIGFSDELIEYVYRGEDVHGHDYEKDCRGVYVDFPSCYWTNSCYRSTFWHWF